MLASVSAGQGRWWAWEDLNLRPHPYQLNAGNRCADHPFRRSRSTVRAKGMRSIGAQVCVRRDARFLPLASTRAQPTVVSHPAHGHCTLAVAKRHKRGRSSWCWMLPSSALDSHRPAWPHQPAHPNGTRRATTMSSGSNDSPRRRPRARRDPTLPRTTPARIEPMAAPRGQQGR
jgi:hypothetical protein